MYLNTIQDEVKSFWKYIKNCWEDRAASSKMLYAGSVADSEDNICKLFAFYTEMSKIYRFNSRTKNKKFFLFYFIIFPLPENWLYGFSKLRCGEKKMDVLLGTILFFTWILKNNCKWYSYQKPRNHISY